MDSIHELSFAASHPQRSHTIASIEALFRQYFMKTRNECDKYLTESKDLFKSLTNAIVSYVSDLEGRKPVPVEQNGIPGEALILSYFPTSKTPHGWKINKEVKRLMRKYALIYWTQNIGAAFSFREWIEDARAADAAGNPFMNHCVLNPNNNFAFTLAQIDKLASMYENANVNNEFIINFDQFKWQVSNPAAPWPMWFGQIVNLENAIANIPPVALPPANAGFAAAVVVHNNARQAAEAALEAHRQAEPDMIQPEHRPWKDDEFMEIMNHNFLTNNPGNNQHHRNMRREYHTAMIEHITAKESWDRTLRTRLKGLLENCPQLKALAEKAEFRGKFMRAYTAFVEKHASYLEIEGFENIPPTWTEVTTGMHYSDVPAVINALLTAISGQSDPQAQKTIGDIFKSFANGQYLKKLILGRHDKLCSQAKPLTNCLTELKVLAEREGALRRARQAGVAGAVAANRFDLLEIIDLFMQALKQLTKDKFYGAHTELVSHLIMQFELEQNVNNAVIQPALTEEQLTPLLTQISNLIRQKLETAEQANTDEIAVPAFSETGGKKKTRRKKKKGKKASSQNDQQKTAGIPRSQAREHVTWNAKPNTFCGETGKKGCGLAGGFHVNCAWAEEPSSIQSLKARLENAYAATHGLQGEFQGVIPFQGERRILPRPPQTGGGGDGGVTELEVGFAAQHQSFEIGSSQGLIDYVEKVCPRGVATNPCSACFCADESGSVHAIHPCNATPRRHIYENMSTPSAWAKAFAAETPEGTNFRTKMSPFVELINEIFSAAKKAKTARELYMRRRANKTGGQPNNAYQQRAPRGGRGGHRGRRGRSASRGSRRGGRGRGRGFRR